MQTYDQNINYADQYKHNLLAYQISFFFFFFFIEISLTTKKRQKGFKTHLI